MSQDLCKYIQDEMTEERKDRSIERRKKRETEWKKQEGMKGKKPYREEFGIICSLGLLEDEI